MDICVQILLEFMAKSWIVHVQTIQGLPHTRSYGLDVEANIIKVEQFLG